MIPRLIFFLMQDPGSGDLDNRRAILRLSADRRSFKCRFWRGSFSTRSVFASTPEGCASKPPDVAIFVVAIFLSCRSQRVGFARAQLQSHPIIAPAPAFGSAPGSGNPEL